MKFHVERDQFAEAVSWAGRTIPARPPSPMLSGLRIEAIEASQPLVSIASFDFEVSSRVEAAADVADPGLALVPGKLLVEIAKSLPAQPVEFEAEGTRLRLRCGRASFELPTLPVEEYPDLPDMPERSGTVPGPVLAAAVGQVAVAAGREDALPFLTGVRVEVDGERVTLAATDRYRLAVRTLSWAPADQDFQAAALVPARTLADTTKALAHADQVHLAFSSAAMGEGMLGIEGQVDGQHRRTTTRLLEGDFPSYRTLLPAESPTVARVETAALTEAVKRVALVAERSAPVRMVFAGDELRVEAGNGEDPSGLDTIECTMSGDPLERIAFNPGYLLEGLAAISQPVTHMAFTTANKPAVLTGAASLDASAADDYLYLLMPVRLPG